MSTVREVFETNTFGVMAMTQAVLPQFRARRSGVVVNVTSSVTLAPMPLAAAYTASKMAIEGFSGSLAHELEAFNVRVKLVEPGYGPSTRFTANVGSRMEGLFPEAYAAFAEPIVASFAQVTTVTTESDVAEVVDRAANDLTKQLRFPAGPDAVPWLTRDKGTVVPVDWRQSYLRRRTVRIFPDPPPPQKNQSPQSDSSPDTFAPGGISRSSRTRPVPGSTRRNSFSSPSHVPCQSSPSDQVTVAWPV
jgi:hypothetical protein